jgi:Fe-S cluster assembly protein SufD
MSGFSTDKITIPDGEERSLTLNDNGGDVCTEITLGRGAILHLLRLQQVQGALSTRLLLRQQADSQATVHYITLSGNEVRNDIEVSLEGKGATHVLRGLALTTGTEHVANTVKMIHAQPQCHSDQLFRQVLADVSTGAFHGRIVVQPYAQQTAAYQSTNNLLLSEKARMDMQPHLEIYADDVKCSHSAAAGQLDKEAIFYLRSRGVSLPQARRMLLQAFAEKTLDGITPQSVKDEIAALVHQKLIT